MIDKNKKLYIAGHQGMVGSALMKKFVSEGFTNIVMRTFKELDLRNQQSVDQFFKSEKPDYVIIAAAKVGGILANNIYRADFLYDNLMIEANIINSSEANGVKKLIFLGSSCIYPKNCTQPIKEEYLLTSSLEETNEPYAIAKIVGLKLCQSYYLQHNSNFYAIMPCNLYGHCDNFDLNSAHSLPALLRKVHEAKLKNNDNVLIWGSGKPYREFMFVEDIADAIHFLMINIDAKDLYNQNISCLNIGTGTDITISDLALLIKKIIGFQGELKYDPSKPDGTKRKLLDITRITQLGWKYTTSLSEGLIKTYQWFLENKT